MGQAMSTITNRMCLAGSKGAKVKAPLVSNSDAARGNGVLVSEGKRAIVGASYTALLAAFMRRPNAPHANAIGHGLRLMEGGSSPAFMAQSGAAQGALFLFKGHVKRDAINAAFAAHGVGIDAIAGATYNESKKCGGTTLVFPRPLADVEADAVWVVLCSPAGCMSAGGGNTYNPEGLGAMCDAVEIASPAAIPQATESETTQASVEAAPVAATGKRAKRLIAKQAQG
jgi:hypothetical protein